VINAGVSGRDGTVRVTRGETTISDDLKPSDEPDAVEVSIYSLDRVLEEYGPFDVLKMDCEGCEYDAILNSRRIGELRQIQMEYHYGPERLVEALRNAGFEVKATRPKRFYISRARDPNMLVGYIYARKRELGCVQGGEGAGLEAQNRPEGGRWEVGRLGQVQRGPVRTCWRLESRAIDSLSGSSRRPTGTNRASIIWY